MGCQPIGTMAFMLTPVADNLWTTHRPLRFWGVECGTRMNVVRLRDGGLFIHCPVALDDGMRQELEALGPVRVVVASSLYHHIFVGDWQRAFPEAMFCACPGLERKRADLRWDAVLGNEALEPWRADLDQVFFSARFEKEVVFFHRESRTMVCADALLNLSVHPARLTRVAAFLMANRAPGKGYLEYVAVRSRRDAREEVDRMLEWNIDRIVLAHGGLVEGDGRRVLRDAYAWVKAR